MLTDKMPQSGVVIACTPNAIPADQRERWMETGKQVYAAVEKVQELPDGYACRLPSDPAMMRIAAEYVSLDRLCCAFVRWTLVIEPNGGPLWLWITGGEGVKELIRSTFETTSLLGEGVAKAAGFHVASTRVAPELLAKSDRIDVEALARFVSPIEG